MKSRLWLMFQPKLVTQPVVYELGKKFTVVTNIRQASINEEIGLVSIELEVSVPRLKTQSLGWRK